MIAGGGIGDGPIDGVVNLYVIDDATREPVANAEVRVGSIAGETDGDGLFIAEDVTGPQDIAVKAGGNYRQEAWLGVNGANVTINLEVANTGTPPSANISGTIPNLVTTPLGGTTFRIAAVLYSQTDDLGDPANELAQPEVNGTPQNMCFVQLPTDTCAFTVTTRTGKLALAAAITDRDTKGTATLDDDTVTFVGYAIRQGLTVTANQNQTNQTLMLLSAGNQQDLSLDVGAPPASLGTVFQLASIELGDEGVLPLQFLPETVTSVRAPKLSALSGATGYRYIAFATDGATTDTKQSVVLRRALSGPTLDAGTWLDPPSGATVSRTRASWNAVSGATVLGFEISQGATRVANITVADPAVEEFDMPELLTLPSGSLTVLVNAIGADGLDIQNFSLDADRDKLNRVAGQSKTVN